MQDPSHDPSKQYGFSQFAVELNEITPDIKDRLPPTDSRLRPDQSTFEHGDADEAEELKGKLEERQRGRRAELEDGIVPQWFDKDGDGYKFNNKYMEARDNQKWNNGQYYTLVS